MSAHHLTLVWPVVENKQKSPRHGRRRQSTRKALLEILHQQRRQIEGAGYFSASDAPDLYALACAADRADRRRPAFNFRGVRFQIRMGLLRRYVLAPDTGDVLIAGKFLSSAEEQ